VATAARQKHTADILVDRMLTMAADAYRRAVFAFAFSEDDGGAWNELATIWARQLLVAQLLGRAQESRKLIRRGLIPKPDATPIESLGEVAAFDDDSIARSALSRTAVEILNQFVGTIPDLREVASGSIRAAKEGAEALTVASRDRAPALLNKIVKGAQRAAAAGAAPDTLPEPRAVLRAILSDGDAAGVLSRNLETEARTSIMAGFNRAGRAEVQRHAGVMPIMVLSEIQDRRTRGNPAGLYPDAQKHYQMDGFSAATDDPIWDRITPPNGYNCRASIRGMTVAEAKGKRLLRPDGSVDSAALRKRHARQWRILERGEYPDPGF
jgi:hypothetical protein